MKFTKMHGSGNDYVYVDLSRELISDAAALARAISDRHTGVGADGLILIGPSDAADVRMEMYNADGSRAQMCGNGIRCVAKYALEHGLATGPEIRIDTDAGVRLAVCRPVDGRVATVRVDMGAPSLAPSSLPSTLPGDRIVDQAIRVSARAANGSPRPGDPDAEACRNDGTYAVTCVSMGNPHAVVFVDDLDAVSLDVDGPRIECAPAFPERINVHFACVMSPACVAVRTWERGSGATQACGTGACAVGVAAAITRRTQRALAVSVPGGELKVEWADNDHVYLTGPAVEAFSGTWPVS